MSQMRGSGSGNVVDWSNPDLKKLLDKTASWGLDNRSAFNPVPCELQVGWGAGVGRSAMLVYERDNVLVVACDFAIPQGENVRVDRFRSGAMHSAWGVVADGRDGLRDEDRAHGIRVHWIHLR